MGRQQRGKKEEEDTVQVVDSLKEQHEEEQEDKNSDFTDSPDLSSQLNNEEDDNDDGDYREQDRLLPIANVGRIMKLAVPPAAKISKEAKESVQECVSEFITFVSSEYLYIVRVLYRVY